MRRRLGAKASIDLEAEGVDRCALEGCENHAAEGLPVCAEDWARVPQGEQVAYLEVLGKILGARDPIAARKRARARVVTILRGVTV